MLINRRVWGVCSLLVAVSSSAVIDVSQEDFEETIEGDTITLVEFYAPWCQHCQELEPVYTKASEKLAKQARFARVDGTKETKLMGRFGVKGYPSILTFSDGVEIGAFGGERTVEGFEEYVSRFTTPATVQIPSPGKASDFIANYKQNKKKTSVIGLFRTKECDEYKQFALLAQMMRKEVQFGESFSQEVFGKFEFGADVQAAIVSAKLTDPKAHMKYDGQFNAKALMAWTKKQSLAPVPMIDQDNAQDLVEIGLPFFVIFVESEVEDMVSDAREMLMEVRDKYQDKFTFLTADGFQLRDQVEALGLSVHELPQVAIDEVQQDRIYPFKEEITVENLLAFADNFVSGKLKPLKVPDGKEASAPAPAPPAQEEAKKPPPPQPKKEVKKEKTLEEEFPDDDEEEDDEADKIRWAHEDARKRKESKEKIRNAVREDPNAKITKISQSNFASINDEEFVLMYFYTQKCVFCKDVLPVVESIANNGEFKVAKVDGEAETKIIVQMNVTAYPTLWVVRKGQPDARPYTGPRKEADIVSFLKRSASPILSDVSDESKISELAKAVPSVVVGTFTEESSDESIEFDEVATTFRGEFIFGRILDKSAQPSVKLYRHHGGFADEEMLVTYQGAFTSDAIAKWVESESVPLADELSADTVHRYLSKSKPFVTMFYDSNKVGAREEALQLLTPLGRKYRGKMFFLVLDARELSDQLESYGLQYSPLPSMVVDKLDNNGFFKFRGQMNQEPMSEWIGEILEDKIKPQRKSQDFVKPRDTMPVYPLAFSEWEKLVAKRDKAVIVEFWAPWCGFCKNFAPTYKAVGKKIMALGLNSTIMVASMDMTQNELPDGVTLDGYPTVLLFPKSRRAKPISYDGDFSGKDVLAFIKERLSTKKSKRQKPQVMSGIVGETVDFDKKNAKPANEEL